MLAVVAGSGATITSMTAAAPPTMKSPASRANRMRKLPSCSDGEICVISQGHRGRVNKAGFDASVWFKVKKFARKVSARLSKLNVAGLAAPIGVVIQDDVEHKRFDTYNLGRIGDIEFQKQDVMSFVHDIR